MATYDHIPHFIFRVFSLPRLNHCTRVVSGGCMTTNGNVGKDSSMPVCRALCTLRSLSCIACAGADTHLYVFLPDNLHRLCGTAFGNIPSTCHWLVCQRDPRPGALTDLHVWLRPTSRFGRQNHVCSNLRFARREALWQTPSFRLGCAEKFTFGRKMIARFLRTHFVRAVMPSFTLSR